MHPQDPASAAAPFEDEDEISLLDLLRVVAENLWLLILGPLLIGLAALGITFAITPTFTATTTFLPPQQQQSAAASMLQSLGGLASLAGAATGIKSPSDQYVAFLGTNTIMDAMIKRFDLKKRYEQETLDGTRKALKAKTQTDDGKKTGLISVSVDDKDPKFAAELANAYVQELGKMLDRVSLTEAQQRRAFFQKQMDEAQKKLADAESALGASGVNASTIKLSPDTAIAVVATLQAKIAALQVQMAAMRGYLTENAPEFRQALDQMKALREQLAEAQRRDQDSGLPASVDSGYINKYRNFKYQETLFEMMAKQYEVARIDESREGAVIQIVDPAMPPELKSKPKKGLIAVLATLGAGFVLLLFVFVREAWRNARNDPEAAEKIEAIRQALSRR
ncbi:Wzz/FepE/Etk N-terminal domain-containing protein [Amphibiibacter pelophylacis]|uniref:Wzz/FepE/Etk N-terminal domain-containing protein n=1 Tax=Amphibiibacter pelophylacis TaxID=1799477 RepID=A0ACC6P0N9_9BURK